MVPTSRSVVFLALNLPHTSPRFAVATPLAMTHTAVLGGAVSPVAPSCHRSAASKVTEVSFRFGRSVRGPASSIPSPFCGKQPTRSVAAMAAPKDSSDKGTTNPFTATSGAAKRAANTVSDKASNFWNDEVLGAKKAMDRDASKKPGNDCRQTVDVTLDVAVLGGTVPLTYSRKCVCPTCEGTGRLPQTFIDCDTCDGNAGVVTREVSVTVTIPGGIKNGGALRLKDQGDEGTPCGQLYVTVRAAAMNAGAVISRDGDDLITRNVVARFRKKDEPTTVRVRTIEGDWGTLSVPVDAKVGTALRIKGRGVSKTPGGTERGDHLFVIGKIVMEPAGGSGEETNDAEKTGGS